MTSFYDMPIDFRYKAYDIIESLQCGFYPGASSGMLSVSVAHNKFSDLTHILKEHGLNLVNLYKFPIGSDKVPAHLNHGGNYLVANFLPR